MSVKSSQRLLIHAPNIHTGGGLVLLQAVLAAMDSRLRWGQLDMRTRGFLSQSAEIQACYVRRSLMSRLMAEWRLRRTCLDSDVVLCFNSLPPLLPLRGEVIVFVQNRLLIEHGSLADYPLVVRVRIWMERVWGRLLQCRCSRYIVQTPSMAVSLRRWLRHDVPISIVPFAPLEPPVQRSRQDAVNLRFDFVYVASGEAHKNHINLIEAWRLIAEAGYRPSLALTLDPDVYPMLCRNIEHVAAKYDLSISNLGWLSNEAVDALYQAAAAIIYPSSSESFGLPLVEAAQHGLPILASECDYVRDVVEPVETFNPNSPTSIARAVRRFLGVPEGTVRIVTATEFLKEVLR